MKIAIITANLGNFEQNIVENVPQSIESDFFRFTDENFPPRIKAMKPRMQARIVKMFAWQIKPEYDVYIWIDSSCALLNPNSVKWLLEQVKDVDLAVLKHPKRKSITEEADYLKARLDANNQYIIPRYENELINEQLQEIRKDRKYIDDKLYASTVVVYKSNKKTRSMFKEWWYHTSRYHSIDQLSFPYVIFKSGVKYRVIQENYFKSKYISYVRKTT